MKDEYTCTQLAPPPPLHRSPPKVKARALSLKIFMISQVFRVTIIPYQHGLQWFEKIFKV